MRAVLKAFLLLVGVAIVIAAGVAMYVIRTGVSAREQPGAVETFVAGTVRNLAIARRARDLRNPVERSPEIIAAGRAHFADHCAVCHANDGNGDTEMGRGMWPKPPDMRQAQTQDLSDGELFWIIENGIRFTGMPGWGTGTPESEAASWHLVHFVRHLPELSEPELEAMEELNPKPPEEIRQRLEQEEFLRGGEPAPEAPATPHSHPGGSHD
jgi:mono/diheme cytochrome c family protein